MRKTERTKSSSRPRKMLRNKQPRIRKQESKRGLTSQKPSANDKRKSRKELLKCAERGLRVLNALGMIFKECVTRKARQVEEKQINAGRISSGKLKEKDCENCRELQLSSKTSNAWRRRSRIRSRNTSIASKPTTASRRI